MELSDPNVVAALLAGLARSSRPVPQRPKVAATPRPPRSPGRYRCACGHCAQCKDNERWEAIFKAKFADPHYYRDRPVKHSSSLDWAR